MAGLFKHTVDTGLTTDDLRILAVPSVSEACKTSTSPPAGCPRSTSPCPFNDMPCDLLVTFGGVFSSIPPFVIKYNEPIGSWGFSGTPGDYIDTLCGVITDFFFTPATTGWNLVVNFVDSSTSITIINKTADQCPVDAIPLPPYVPLFPGSDFLWNSGDVEMTGFPEEECNGTARVTITSALPAPDRSKDWRIGVPTGINKDGKTIFATLDCFDRARPVDPGCCTGPKFPRIFTVTLTVTTDPDHPTGAYSSYAIPLTYVSDGTWTYQTGNNGTDVILPCFPGSSISLYCEAVTSGDSPETKINWFLTYNTLNTDPFSGLQPPCSFVIPFEQRDCDDHTTMHAELTDFSSDPDCECAFTKITVDVVFGDPEWGFNGPPVPKTSRARYRNATDTGLRKTVMVGGLPVSKRILVAEKDPCCDGGPKIMIPTSKCPLGIPPIVHAGFSSPYASIGSVPLSYPTTRIIGGTSYTGWGGDYAGCGGGWILWMPDLSQLFLNENVVGLTTTSMTTVVCDPLFSQTVARIDADPSSPCYAGPGSSFNIFITE